MSLSGASCATGISSWPKPVSTETKGNEARRTAQSVLWYVLKGSLELLHPYMPFITEELWQHLPGSGGEHRAGPVAQPVSRGSQRRGRARMERLMEAIKAIRNVRAETSVPPGREISAAIFASDEATKRLLEENGSYIRGLAKVNDLVIASSGDPKPEKAVTAVAAGIEISLPLAGLIDLEEERARLQKELEEVTAELARSKSRLSSQGFLEKAPAHVVEGARARHRELEASEAKLRARLAELS